jgi:adenine-specific DNA-methyltransferase
VRTADIAEGRVEWRRAWLVNPWTTDGALVSLGDHPRLAKYLTEHEARLCSRHVAKKNEDAWYRTIDKVIPGLREQRKLLFQDMKMTIEPVLDDGDYYPHHNLYWVTSDTWDLRVLGGLLLSRVAEFFVSSYAVRMRGGTLRFQAQYLRRIRVPEPDSIAPVVAQRLARAFDARDVDAATDAALQAYGIDCIPD